MSRPRFLSDERRRQIEIDAELLVDAFLFAANGTLLVLCLIGLYTVLTWIA